jgi:hypothetical protein
MTKVNTDGDSTPQTDDRSHHIADEPVGGGVQPRRPEIHSPVTDTGLPVEDQIDKEWNPDKDGGLPTFLNLPCP